MRDHDWCRRARSCIVGSRVARPVATAYQNTRPEPCFVRWTVSLTDCSAAARGLSEVCGRLATGFQIKDVIFMK